MDIALRYIILCFCEDAAWENTTQAAFDSYKITTQSFVLTTAPSTLLFHWLELQPINILAILDTDRLPTWFHFHANLQLIDKIGLDLPHGFDFIFKLGDANHEEALVKAPRQVENRCVGQEFGIALGFDFLKLSAFALQAAIMERIVQLPAFLTLVGGNGNFFFHDCTLLRMKHKTLFPNPPKLTVRPISAFFTCRFSGNSWRNCQTISTI